MSLALLSCALLTSAAFAAAPDGPALDSAAQEVKADLGLSVNALVAALPNCQTSKGDGSLVLEEGCVDGVCVTDELTDAIAVFEATCKDATYGGDGQRHCKTEDGIAFFDARNAETRRRDNLHTFYLGKDYEGRTVSGLGVGVSLSCYLREFGTPDKVEIERVGDRFAITELRFVTPKVWVQAEDGVTRRVVVYGPKSP
jgi:hypothetical protein